MKGCPFVAVVVALSMWLAACATSEESCLQECGVHDIKEQNKCNLDHIDSHGRNLACSKKASTQASACFDKCFGNP